MDDSSSDDEPLSMMLARKDGNGTAKANGGKAEVKKDPAVKAEPFSPAPPKPQPPKSKAPDGEGKAKRESTGGGSAKPKVKKEAGAGKAKVSPKVKKEEAKAAAAKKVRKVYDLPGQTRDTPSEMDPLRKFYTSLRQQRPESAMAAKWLCTHGLLSQEEAEEYVVSTKGAGGLKSPEKARAKSAATRKPPQQSHKKPASAPPKKKAERPSSTKKGAPVKKEQESSSEEEADDSDDSEEEVLPTKKRAKVEGSSKAAPAKRAPKKGGIRAVFEDDCLESDSDDDKPLAARKA